MATQNIGNKNPATVQQQQPPPVAPKTPQPQTQTPVETEVAPQPKELPGIYNLETTEGRKQAQKLWVQITGLTFNEEGVENLTRQLSAKLLAQAKAGFTQQTLEQTPPKELAKTWGAFVSQAGQGYGSEFDVNSLVQYVLREAYMENTLDLHFYAQKVKFFNATKKAIRDQLTKAREALAKTAGKKPEDLLDKPFMYTKVDATYTGSLEANTLPITPEAQQAVAAYTAASQAANEANAKALTGSGVTLWTGTPALNPAAKGDVFITGDGHRVDVKGSEVTIYSPKADGTYKQETRIWGDPHVNEGGGGDNWHFGDDSTFILPDGTKICLNTEETSPGVFVVKGVDIMSGEDHAYTGLSPDGGTRSAGVDPDRLAWDEAHQDTRGSSGGVFAMQSNGQWAKYENGVFKDVDNESWSGYLSSKDVTTRGGAVTLNTQQQNAANQILLTDAVNANTARADSMGAAQQFAAITKEDLETYIKNTEEQLNSVGDDAQLANVDLQNMLQKQQQTLQMMSNISKMLHDTAMAVIRKVGS